MNTFTQAYTKAKSVIEKQEYEKEWNTFLSTKCSVKRFLGDKGFSKGCAKSPDLIRAKISELATSSKTNTGEVIYKAASGGSPNTTTLDRAATLKMLRHVHRIHEQGGQDVWVYSPPKELPGWLFDEIAGDSTTVKAKLAKDTELFSDDQMKWMSSALSVARKVSMDTRAKLSSAFGMSKRTKEVVTRWFLDETCGKDELTMACEQLTKGFKKIATACNAATLVFTDYPDWRAQRDRYFGGAIRGGEGGGFPIIYLEGAFTRLTGNTGKLWLCAETIVHELSHLEVCTRDHRYDSSGLKPNSGTFAFTKAVENADSWGYFALDLAGYLSDTDRATTLK